MTDGQKPTTRRPVEELLKEVLQEEADAERHLQQARQLVEWSFAERDRRAVRLRRQVITASLTAAALAAAVLVGVLVWPVVEGDHADRFTAKLTGPHAGGNDAPNSPEYQVWYTPKATGCAVLVHNTQRGLGVTPNRYFRPGDWQPVVAEQPAKLEGLFIAEPGRPQPYLVLVTDRPAGEYLVPFLERWLDSHPGGQLGTGMVGEFLRDARRHLASHDVVVLDHAFNPDLKPAK